MDIVELFYLFYSYYSSKNLSVSSMAEELSNQTTLKHEVSRLEKELEAMTAVKIQQETLASQSGGLVVSLMSQVESLKEQLKEAQTDRDYIATKAKDDAERLGGMRQMIEGRFTELAEHCQLLIDERNRLQEENERLSALTSNNESTSSTPT
jgi:chromosome segregation ATPase